MCSGNCGCGNCSTSLPIGQPGSPGENGEDGQNGIFGGYSSAWLYDNVGVTGNVAARYFQFNDTDPTAASVVFINQYNYLNDDIEPFVQSFYNNGNFGYLKIFDEFNSDNYFYYKITGVVNNSPVSFVTTLNVEYISGNGTLTTGSTNYVVISFSGNAEAILVADGESSDSLNFPIVQTTLTLVPSTETSPLSAGTYLVWSDFIVENSPDNSSTTVHYQYGTNGSVVGSERVIFFNDQMYNVKLSCSAVEKITVAAGDTIALYMSYDASVNSPTVDSQSVQYIKIG